MFQILLVEDDWELNQVVCAFCAKNGFEARGCPGAAEAYDAMYETRFDLILSDIMMPGVDGFDFAETVRELDELLLRIHALLRRAGVASSKRLTVAP